MGEPTIGRPQLAVIRPLLRRVVPAQFGPKGFLTRLVRQHTHNRVWCGPFRGMRYIENSIGSAYLPKLLGTYERELAEVMEMMCALRPGLIVDVGAAEGYYAVGLALRNPGARVIAFERELAGRAALLKMAMLNHVEDRMQILGECGPREFQAALTTLSGRMPFILCDVEGDEDGLLDPIAVPGLRTAFVLAETHEFICPGITNQLQTRFAATHHISCIWQTLRAREDFPFRGGATRLLPRSYLAWAVSEWRPERMCWLWMQPRE